MKSLNLFLRSHLHFIVIVPLLIIAVTWPIFPNLFDGESFWLPTQSRDVFMKYWDGWYGKSLLASNAEYYATDLQFHPDGLSLVFHNFSLPQMLVFGALQGVMLPDAAYGLTHLLTIFANVLSAYVVFLAWFRDKWVALSGAVVFGMHPFTINHSQNPEVVFLVTIPLALYAFDRGIRARRRLWLAASACLVGLTAFIGMYILICLLILLGIYTLWLAATFWRNSWFWRGVALVLSLAAAISMIRVYPMLVDAPGLDEALAKGNRQFLSADLLEYVTNPRHPQTGPLLSTVFDGVPHHANSGHSYFGFLCFAVIAYGLIACSCRRRLQPWLLGLLFFAIMSLGMTLTINGHVYERIRLPGFYLTNWFPWLFKGFWAVEHYLIGIHFPAAVLFAYGLQQIAARLPLRRRSTVILALLLLCAYERYHVPLPGLTIPQARLDFIDWLADEPNQDDIHIINLPMGRGSSKVYGFYQTFNGYPQVEGLAARTPAASYDYIEGNLLLRTWRRFEPIHCLPSADGGFQRSLQQLQSDRFTYIVAHQNLEDLKSIPQTFKHVTPAYTDDWVEIYRIDDLDSACDSTALLHQRPQPSLSLLLDFEMATPDLSVAVLSIHSRQLESGKLLDYYSALNPASVELLPMHTRDLRADETPRIDAPNIKPADALAANQIVIFASDPRQTDPDLVSEYRTWVERDLESCGRLFESDDLLAELFLPPDFPCDLIVDDEFGDIDYANNYQLGNVILRRTGDALDAFFKWNRLPSGKHAISVQFFSADEKAYNQDFVLRRESLQHHRIDLADLPPGDYQVKTVVYNYETGVSVPGALRDSDARFERALDMGRLTIE